MVQVSECVSIFVDFNTEFFSHIMTVYIDMDIIYSAASLKCHAPHTWHGTTPGHIILKPSRSVLALLLMPNA